MEKGKTPVLYIISNGKDGESEITTCSFDSLPTFAKPSKGFHYYTRTIEPGSIKKGPARLYNAIYVFSGTLNVAYGKDLKKQAQIVAGDLIFTFDTNGYREIRNVGKISAQVLVFTITDFDGKDVELASEKDRQPRKTQSMFEED